ncbi:MAG: acetyltransferase [Gemmatales bacterium]|nr:MAG: acetyltransferase [Gemmatales bacterium]
MHIRTMTADDLPFGMFLKEQAGWNQTEQDWRRFLSLQPDGCFIAENADRPLGTAVAFVFQEVAWIAMVLVEKTARGQGIGKALLRHALGFLERHQVRSIRLDATPLGQPLYERNGFVPQFQLTRFEGVPRSAASFAKPIVGLAEANDLLCAFDATATRTDRRKLLKALGQEASVRWFAQVENNDLRGYLALRPGALAWQIGPAIAMPESGEALFQTAWSALEGQRVFVDIPAGNSQAVACAQSAGLSPQRQLLRMCRGEWICENISQLWASSGPEKG